MIVSCSHCHKPLNNAIRFCPHCGVENQRPVSENTASCPRCGCGLEEEAYRGSTIDLCPRCGGLWLDTEEFAFHASTRDTFNDPDIPRTYRKQPFSDPSGYLPCVRCNTPMVKQNFRRISGILIDVCARHGVWLDAGELEQIRSFIANGGLDRSQDKAIQENRGAIETAARETKDLRTLFRTLHKFDLKRIFLERF